jgi:hypothetical protein
MTDNLNSVQDLIKALFYEAGRRTGKPETKNAMAKNIRNWLIKNRRFDVSERTLTRQYDRYILGSKDSKGAAPSAELQDEYAIYLNYKNYSDFVMKTNNQFGSEKTGSAGNPKSTSQTPTTNDNRQIIIADNYEQVNEKNEENIHVGRDYIKEQNITNSPESKGSKWRSWWILIIVIFIAAVVSVILWSQKVKNDETLCLFWKENHFEQMSCENGSQDDSDLVISTDEWQDTYKNFRKIRPDQNTRFFDSNGKPVIWYQYRNGGYEFFNQSGVHPVNGRKLLPVKPSVVDDYFDTLQKGTPNTPAEHEESSVGPNFMQDDPEFTESGLPDTSAENDAPKGKYCFKNESDKTLTTYIYGDGQLNDKITLQPKEEACLYLAVNEYRYSTEIRARPGTVITSGNIMVRENREGSISLSIPEPNDDIASKESTIPETKPKKDCSKGDFCFKNNTDGVLHIRIGDKTDGPLGSTFYLHLTVPPRGEECFYDIPAIAYDVQYHFNELTLNNLHKYTNIKVTGCQTNTKVL